MPTREEIEIEIIKQAAMYLMYDKENETVLRTAFVALAQERHINFHTDKERKEVDEASDFADCKNDMCQAAVRVLEEAREPAIELTPLTSEMLQGYVIGIKRGQNIVRVGLVRKEETEEPKILSPDSMKLKI